MVTPEQLAGDSEHSQQVALFCWAALRLNNGPPDAINAALRNLFAIPNGDQRGSGDNKEDRKRGAAIAGARLKSEGQRNGVPDTLLAMPHGIKEAHTGGYIGTYCGLFIEMKRPDLKRANDPTHGCSPEQLDWHARLSQAGYAVVVCYTWEEARDAILRYLA